ncbi:MAG: DNA recombination protein RmuC [Armatimonadota bacterium]
MADAGYTMLGLVIFGVIFVLGVGLGALAGWLHANSRLGRQLAAEREQRVAAETRLGEVQKQIEAQRSLVDEATAKMSDVFKALSSDALRSNSQAFVDSAKQTLEPLREALSRYDQHVGELERTRREDYGSLAEQVKSLMLAEQQLQRETGNLVNALRRPQVRGRWGEMTLRRVAELAGMSQYCDFDEQVSISVEGGRLRPDMVVRLPAGRTVVVDAKCSLDAYLNAVAETDEAKRRVCLGQHCRQLRDHMNALALKSYWDQFPSTPEFVVMFVPGESFLAAAMDEDPKLFDDGLEKKVLLAGPINLIALLQSAAHGWRQEQVEENAQRISELGAELYRRVRTFLGHFSKIGRELTSANEAFNAAVGSLDRNVLPQARRFRELGVAGGEEAPAVETVDVTPRSLAAPEAEGG